MAQFDVGITYLLCFCFGVFGLHKCYLGNVGMGIIYALTGGLCLIGLICDICTIPAQVAAANASHGGNVVIIQQPVSQQQQQQNVYIAPQQGYYQQPPQQGYYQQQPPQQQYQPQYTQEPPKY